MMRRSKLFKGFNVKDRLSSQQIKDFERTYELFTQIPLITGGFIAGKSPSKSGQCDAVHIIKSQKNVRQKTSRRYLESYVALNGEYARIPWLWNVSATSIFPSPSRDKLAVINKISVDENDKNKKQSVIEIYDQQQLVDTIYPPASTFGDVHKSEPFAAVSWNKQENLIAFIAEKEDKKSENFLKDKTLITKGTASATADDEKSTDETKPDDDKLCGDTFVFKETFGEQMNGAKATSLFIYDLERKQLFDLSETETDVFPNAAALSECVFDPNDTASILLVAHATYPRRLGLKFYNTRPTSLWLLQLPSYIVSQSARASAQVMDIATDDHSPRYVRFSPNGQYVTYLSTNNTYAHLAAQRLRCIAWPSSSSTTASASSFVSETIIDIPTEVRSEDVLKNGAFGGIFCYAGVPSRCWLDDETMLINSVRGHVFGAYMINVKQKRIAAFDQLPAICEAFNDLKNEICRDLYVLDVDAQSGHVLFQTSSIQRGHTANIYNMQTQTMHRLAHTIDVEQEKNELIQSIRNIETRVIQHKIADVDDHKQQPSVLNNMYESILYVPPKNMTTFDRDPILLLYAHGGPHSCNTALYSYSLLSLLYSGFAVLQVNYRGSIGVSESFTHCLLGNIGDMDVRDCMNAYNEVCTDTDTYFASRNVDADRLKKIVMGGSHGGFLTGHLIGQYPDVFMAASSRNPVLNLVSMMFLSDIPDWILCEAGLLLQYDSESNEEVFGQQPLLDAAKLNAIHQKSPYVHIDKVRTPYQILCGAKDQRVPMQQAIDYYKLLRARNGDGHARLLVYPDCQHSLNDTMEQELDAWLNVIAWFYYHTKETEKQETAVDRVDDLIARLDM